MKIARIISLATLGANHTDDFLKFSDISYKEAKAMQNLSGEEGADSFIEILKDKFMDGSITDDETNKAIKVTKENLDELPVSVLTMAVEKLVGGTDENLG